jgi:hypothetical protein
MKHGFLAFLAAAFLLGVCAAAATIPALAAAPAASVNPPTTIIVDEKSGMVRIVINGQDKLIVDASGIHVNGSVAHSGADLHTVEYHPTPSDIAPTPNAGQTSK